MLLNATAAFIWQHQSLARTELIRRYAANFQIPELQAANDIDLALSLWSGLSPPSVLKPGPAPTSIPACTSNIRLAGMVFRLHFGTLEIAAEVVPRLHHLEISAASPEHTFSIDEELDGYTVTRDSVRFVKEPLLTGARAQLLLELTRLAAQQQDFAAVLHAGACGTAEGALILAGASHSGKSTLCVALMEAGWLCYSDDSAPLDRNFQVTAMPFALVLREPSKELFPSLKQHPTFERYGTKVCFVPSNVVSENLPAAPARALIFVDYSESAPAAALTPVGPFDALVSLQQSGFWIEHTQPSIAAFLAWLTAIPRYRLTYSNLSRAIEQLRPLL